MNYKHMICPSCGSELWIIKNLSFKCFLCECQFFGKDILTNPKISETNKLLQEVMRPNKEMDDFWDNDGEWTK